MVIVTVINCYNLALIRYRLHFIPDERAAYHCSTRAVCWRLPSCTVNGESLEVTLIPPKGTNSKRSGVLLLFLFFGEAFFKSKFFLHMCRVLVYRSSLG